MNYLRSIVRRPFSLAWLIVTGVVSIVVFLGLEESYSQTEKTLFTSLAFLAPLFFGLLFETVRLFEQSKSPVKVRTIVEGDHYYQGTVVLILDKSNWIESGQVLTLVQNADGVETPIALIRVETFTTQNFPQCVLVAALTTSNLPEYLSDRSRWKSMEAKPEVKAHYLEGAQNG